MPHTGYALAYGGMNLPLLPNFTLHFLLNHDRMSSERY